MLFVSVVLSLLLLSVYALPLINGRKPRAHSLLSLLFILAGWPCVMFPSLALQAIVLAVVFGADALFGFGKRTYLVLVCVCSLLVYLGVSWVAMHNLAALRLEFRYESLEGRLSAVGAPPASRGKPVTDSWLTAFEDRVDIVARQQDEHGRLGRDNAFASLHEHAIIEFINSPGFGQSRMPTVEHRLRRWTFEDTIIPQPAVRSSADDQYRADTPLAAGRFEQWYLDLHRDSFTDFVNTEGFGYFKDRGHVGFFRPHQFRSKPAAMIDLLNITLIGLVLHDRPVAYVSDTLPRMDVLRKAKTRSLDDFERFGLDRIKQGHMVVAHQQGDRLRLLGAIRATRQCVECHSCERGELLGAFSYVLKRQ